MKVNKAIRKKYPHIDFDQEVVKGVKVSRIESVLRSLARKHGFMEGESLRAISKEGVEVCLGNGLILFNKSLNQFEMTEKGWEAYQIGVGKFLFHKSFQFVLEKRVLELTFRSFFREKILAFLVVVSLTVQILIWLFPNVNGAEPININPVEIKGPIELKDLGIKEGAKIEIIQDQKKDVVVDSLRMKEVDGVSSR